MLKNLIDSSWTLFLDRDGVINKRIFGGYILSPKDFHFEAGVLDFLKFANNHFYKIVVVTNQQGVGKGLMTSKELNRLHDFMIDIVLDNGGRIDKVFCADNLKGAIDDRRKPLPVMGIEAKKEFPKIEFTKSIMIGDTDSDIKFGKHLGMKTILIKSKEEVVEDADFQINALNELIF